ncbi:hypothetical protein Tco_0608038 [Tanacetum coccineum]
MFGHGMLSPFKIIDRIGLVAYKLELPDELHGIHNTFHVSNLKKCLADENQMEIRDEVWSLHGNAKIISRASILISSRVIRRRARGIEHQDDAPLKGGGCNILYLRRFEHLSLSLNLHTLLAPPQSHVHLLNIEVVILIVEDNVDILEK